MRRPPKVRLSALTLKAAQQRGVFCFPCFPTTLLSVSYTHLDVYKRQTEEDVDYVAEVLVKGGDRLRELSPVTGQEGW